MQLRPCLSLKEKTKKVISFISRKNATKASRLLLSFRLVVVDNLGWEGELASSHSGATAELDLYYLVE